MTIQETIESAMRGLRTNGMRSALTVSGIIIGVAAVIVLVALGNGMKAGFDSEFGRLANQITVTTAKGSVPGGGVARPLTDQDVEALNHAGPGADIDSVTPSMLGSVVLTEGQHVERAGMIGSSYNYLTILNRSIENGRWFTPSEVRGDDREAVLGEGAIALLWGHDANLDQVVGSRIRVNHTTFTVIGVLLPDGQNDNTVIVPFGTSRAYLVGNQADNVNQIIVKSTSADRVDQASNSIISLLDRRHFIRTPADQDFTVHSYTHLLTDRTQFITFLTLFIVMIAAISLFVGGIGVANIMLVSVTERTREIGIRKAVGAPKRAIMRQFLMEAVVLTTFGGMIGVVIGVGLTLGAAALIPHIPTTVSPPVFTIAPVVIAFAVSVLVGIVAGSYPANRAARLHPIEALRFE